MYRPDVVAGRIGEGARPVPEPPEDRAAHVGRKFAPAQLVVHRMVGADQKGFDERPVLLEQRDGIDRQRRYVADESVGGDALQKFAERQRDDGER